MENAPMTKLLGLLATATALVCFASTPSLAGTYSLVPAVPGSTSTAVFGISDNGTLVGSYSTTTDFSDEHGFFGTYGGKYTTFDYVSDGTEPRAINSNGEITGIASATLADFDRSKKGSIATITKSSTPIVGITQGINASGQFVGDYFGTGTPARGGYYGANGAYIADITLPFATNRTSPRGINSSGAVTGFYVVAGVFHGFLLKNGVVTIIDFPGGIGTTPEGINDNGQISGAWTDSSGNSHGFLLSANLSTWTTLDAPGATNTQAWGVNNAGQVALDNIDNNNIPYIYCSGPGNAHNICDGNPAKGKSAAVKALRVLPTSYAQHQCVDNCLSNAGQKNWPGLEKQMNVGQDAKVHFPKVAP
jgi:hypothetical protein